MSTQQVQSRYVTHATLTVPATGSAAATIESMVATAFTAAGLDLPSSTDLIGLKIHSAGQDLVIGNSATDLPLTLTAGDPLIEPARYFWDKFLKSAGVATAAVVAVYHN